MKRVLFVATVVGHINAFHIPYLKLFNEQGWETHVAAHAENEQEQHINHCDIFHEICFTRSPFTFNNMKAYFALKKLIEENDFDIIHCHTPVGGALTRLAAKDMRAKGHTKVIYTAHGFHFYKGAPLLNWLVYYPIERYLSRYTDVLITINKEDYTIAKNKMHAERTEYVPGVGIDIEKIKSVKVDRNKKRAELGIPQDAFVLISVGELNKNKNHEVVIKAVGSMYIMKEAQNIHYIIAGQGPLDKYLLNLAQRYGLENRVHLLGFRADVIELLKSSDCFVFPSCREGLGLAALEAMASGLPLISTRAGGIKDYAKDGVTGCCLNCPSDITAMTLAIRTMHDHAEFREQCALNNVEMVKQFDLHRSLSVIAQIYRNMY